VDTVHYPWYFLLTLFLNDEQPLESRCFARSPRQLYPSGNLKFGRPFSREKIMGPLRYSINVTLDGCCDHRAIVPDEEMHHHHAENLARADALLFGRVTYEMMEEAWRPVAAGAKPDWMEPWVIPFAKTIDTAKKYVVSSTLHQVDWNAELVRGNLGEAVQRLKRESRRGLLMGGMKLPLALAELGLIDEYEFVVHPRLAGHGPTLLAGLSKYVDLKLVSRVELRSGAVAMRYEPKKVPATPRV
jgi:dihydrofolate reductase